MVAKKLADIYGETCYGPEPIMQSDGRTTHGVSLEDRYDEAGNTFRPDHWLGCYQQGVCTSCGRGVFSTRPTLGGSWHDWRLRQYIIKEEDWLEL